MPEEMVGAAQSLMRVSLARSGRWASGVAFAGGFISDVLNPLAPFAAYIALAAAIGALVVAIAIVLRLTVTEKGVPALLFAATVATISGAIYAMQRQTDARDGLIASIIPAVAELQKSVGLVAEKVERIEETVTETQKTVVETQKTVTATQETVEDVKASTEKVEAQTEKLAAGQEDIAKGQEAQAAKTDKLAETTGKVAEQTQILAENQAKQAEQTTELLKTTEKIAVSIETIADGFATLAQQGGIIADPKRPDEFYHNARLYELGGDMLNARRAYLAFAAFDIDAVDPYIRFATLLRVQDGRAGAREVFGALADKSKAPAVKLIHTLQFEDAQRLQKLEAFVAANPDYAPAYYLLAQEFSEDRLGAQTLLDKRREAEALTRFLSDEKDGALLKHFIDHTLLAEWLERSRSRLAALGNVLDPALFTPKMIAQRSNQDWMITISLAEAATGISWRMGNEGPFTDTGLLALNDQRTGKPMPNPSFALPASTPAGIIAIKYLDMRGRETGPFEIRFEPETMLLESTKQILDQFWTSWIAFDASGNRGNVYFSHIVSYRCAVNEVRYGFNGGPLDKTLPMPPCNQKDPYALPDNFMPFFKVGEEVTSMSVQVTYADGTSSPVREFLRQ